MPDSFAEQTHSAPAAGEFDEAERRFMLELARRAVADAAAGADSVELETKDVPPRLTQKRACFVTLTSHGSLRGCIGNMMAVKPLFEAVVDNARGAAARDPRFPPVQPAEVEEMQIEISVLTEPEPLAFASPRELLDKLQPNRDGVLLRIGRHCATFLPQVWEKVPDKTEFLNRLAQKAGFESGAWREADASISVYQVERFEEAE